MGEENATHKHPLDMEDWELKAHAMEAHGLPEALSRITPDFHDLAHYRKAPGSGGHSHPLDTAFKASGREGRFRAETKADHLARMDMMGLVTIGRLDLPRYRELAAERVARLQAARAVLAEELMERGVPEGDLKGTAKAAWGGHAAYLKEASKEEGFDYSPARSFQDFDDSLDELQSMGTLPPLGRRSTSALKEAHGYLGATAWAQGKAAELSVYERNQLASPEWRALADKADAEAHERSRKAQEARAAKGADEGAGVA